jgi:rhodanese-related sulfurtransferase
MAAGRSLILLLCVIAVILAGGCGSRTEFPDLSAKELKTMLDANPGLVVVDTRTAVEYHRGHVPRSVFIPEEKFFALELLLPKSKDTPLVFYCRGFG